jgi:hypothetical protein
MSRRRPDAKTNPINRRQKALDEQTANLKAELEKNPEVPAESARAKAEARRREQQEILSTYRRPVRLEGPSDFRYEVSGGKKAKPRKLRKERSSAPVLTLVLFVTFAAWSPTRSARSGTGSGFRRESRNSGS